MTTMMKKPGKLNPGDKVAAVTLSWGGPGAIPIRYEAGKKQFEDMFGVQVVETKNALRDPDWISKNPKARADDLMEAFSDAKIKGIISTIGGEESVRILPHIDLNLIQKNPKVFMGYSDTTVTHLACFKAGLVSFYGPAFMAGLAENGGIMPYMANSLKRTLFQNEPIGDIQPNSDGWTVERLEWTDPANQTRKRKLTPTKSWNLLQGKGVAKGHLIGGCAEVLEFLKGTDYWPTKSQWKDAILFIETSEEAPAPDLFKRWLRNYGSQGILQELSGILVGRPGGHELPTADFEKYDQAVLQVVRDEVGLAELPIMTQMDFGHTDPFFVLPYGIQAEIHCARGCLKISESAVV